MQYYEIFNVIFLHLSTFHCPMVSMGLQLSVGTDGDEDACCNNGVGTGTKSVVGTL